MWGGLALLAALLPLAVFVWIYEEKPSGREGRNLDGDQGCDCLDDSRVGILYLSERLVR